MLQNAVYVELFKFLKVDNNIFPKLKGFSLKREQGYTGVIIWLVCGLVDVKKFMTNCSEVWYTGISSIDVYFKCGVPNQANDLQSYAPLDIHCH